MLSAVTVAGILFEAALQVSGRVVAWIWRRTRSRRLRKSMEQRYLESVIRRYEQWSQDYVEIRGTREGPSVALSDDITVHPAMYALTDPEGSVEPRVPSAGEQRDNRVRVELSRIVEQVQQFVLLGEPGSGKTSHLQWLALKHARLGVDSLEGQRTLPVLIDLGGYGGPLGAVDFVKGCLRDEHGLAGAYIAENLVEYLDEGRLLLLLDGLNQIPAARYRQRVDRLRVFADQNQRNKFVFSCRVLDYEYRFGWPRVMIDPLDEAQVEEFVTRYLPATGTQLMQDLRSGDRALLDLARNPFMLRMMILVYARDERLPAVRPRLMDEFARRLLAREKREAWLATAEAEDAIGALAHLAFAITEHAQMGTEVKRTWAESVLAVHAASGSHQAGSTGADLLKLAADASLLVLSRSRNTVQYHHELFQEFFSALVLKARWEAGDDLRSLLSDCWWDSTIQFASGLVDNPDDLIRGILSFLGPERGALLAGACCAEVAARLDQETTRAVLSSLARLPQLGLGTLGTAAMDLIARIDYRCIEDLVLEPRPESDQHPAVQTVMLMGAGHGGISPLYMGPFAFHVHDVGWDMRRYAAALVRTLGSDRVTQVVLDVLRQATPDGGLYFVAAAVLADLASREAADVLATVLRHGHGRARQDAARGLGKIGDVANEPLLTRTLLAPMEGLDLRRECAAALRMMLGPEYLEELAQSSHDAHLMAIVQSEVAPPWRAMQRARAHDDHPRGAQTSELMDLDLHHLLQRLLNPPDDQPYLWVPYELAAALALKGDEEFIPDLEGALDLCTPIPPSAHYDHKAKEALWWIIDAIREKRRRRGRPPKLSSSPRDWSAFGAPPV